MSLRHKTLFQQKVSYLQLREIIDIPQNKLCEYLHNYDHRVTVSNCMIELVSDCLTEKIEVPGTPVTAPQLLIEDGNMIIYMNSIK